MLWHNKTKRMTADHVLCISTLGLVGLMTLCGIVASSIYVSADGNDTTESTASVTVAISCSINTSIDTEHTATVPNGIYSGTELYPNGIGKTTIATFCNDNSGYAIYAIGFSGDQYSGADHTKLIGQTTSEKIVTGTATNGNTSNWSMKLIKETDSTQSYNPANLTITNSYDDYNSVPDTYTKVANYTSTTDRTLGSVLSTTYAAYISGTQVADTYIGKVKYTLVHPNNNDPSSYIVNFAANGGTGTMTAQKIPHATATALTSNGFTAPTGYVFNGWNTAPDGSGTSYTDGQSVTSIANAGGSIALYAQWQQNYTLADITNMQDTFSCEDTPAGTTNTLTDTRDGSTYLVKKLADGKCWMLDNLALDLTDSTVLNNVTASNTNASATSLGYLKNGGGTTSDQYATAGVANWTSSYSYSAPLVSASGSGWTKDTVVTHYGVGSGKIGAYYNYCAASAGSYCYGNGTSEGTSSGNATEDICPAGWRMPTGDSSGEFSTLYSYYNTTTATDPASFQYNLSTPLSGYFLNGSASSQGSYGFWWSTAWSDSTSMFNLYLNSSDVYPADFFSFARYYGYSLRCVAGS